MATMKAEVGDNLNIKQNAIYAANNDNRPLSYWGYWHSGIT